MSDTVLIVEDERDVLDLVRHNLRRTGFNVLTAMDGSEAIDSARRNRPDVIILDLMLPKMSGYEVCTQLRNSADTARIPILMLTARSEQTDRLAGFEKGADDYVTKPFSPKELVYRVAALARRSRIAAPPEEIEVEGLCINRKAMKVTLHGRVLDLTAIEFKLLNVLVEERGKVQERQSLLSRVWNYSKNVNSRTLDTHMRRLRKKLEAEADRIETVHGEGYRFRTCGESEMGAKS